MNLTANAWLPAYSVLKAFASSASSTVFSARSRADCAPAAIDELQVPKHSTWTQGGHALDSLVLRDDLLNGAADRDEALFGSGILGENLDSAIKLEHAGHPKHLLDLVDLESSKSGQLAQFSGRRSALVDEVLVRGGAKAADRAAQGGTLRGVRLAIWR